MVILSSNLDVIFDGHIADVVIKPGTTLSYKSIQIAALPAGGWVALATIGDSLTLYALDAAGKVVATSALDSKTTVTAGIRRGQPRSNTERRAAGHLGGR